ncbi:hypothetical protein ACFXA0_31140 [Streptomyces cyaneofuscatus]|uniref:hypothetical protein n=1 Tax=Streptomyces cyaneofuscatus TaxID=66883 RepID=UPI0036B5C886
MGRAGVAVAHPELVRALVLVEAGPDGPSPSLPETIGAWLDSWPVLFPDAAHDVHLDDPGAVFGQVAAFLAEVDPAAAV